MTKNGEFVIDLIMKRAGTPALRISVVIPFEPGALSLAKWSRAHLYSSIVGILPMHSVPFPLVSRC